MFLLRFSLVSLILFATALPTYADAVIYDEAVSDLGDSPADPTDLGNLMPGDNIILGELNGGGTFDPDVFSFTVPSNLRLTSITFDLLSSEFRSHFFAFNDGPVSLSDGGENLISTLLQGSDEGANMLTFRNIFGAGGATPPLGPGTYQVLFQETDDQPVVYELRLTTTVPEPGTLMLLATSGLFLLRRRKQR